MTKKNLIRAAVWIILVVVLTIITYYNYQIFITNTVEKEIAQEKMNSSLLQRQITNIQKSIAEYNNYLFDDGNYSLMIPDNDEDILLNYVIDPLLIVEGNYSSFPTIKDEMPTSINWPKNKSPKDLKAKKITVEFEINPNNFNEYLDLLQNIERIIYIGDYRITIIDKSNIRVLINYYLFYEDTKTT